jgi:hypothetical protein
MPVEIHGKQYNTVAERITSAGDNLLGVETEILFNDPVVIKATITVQKITGSKETEITHACRFTGISSANPSKSIEKENPYEVAETSAVGRALAFAGYETTNGIASAEEMYKSQRETPANPNNEFKNSVCQRCGGRIAISKQGKPYCINRCWLPENKHFITEFKNKK